MIWVVARSIRPNQQLNLDLANIFVGRVIMAFWEYSLRNIPNHCVYYHLDSITSLHWVAAVCIRDIYHRQLQM